MFGRLSRRGRKLPKRLDTADEFSAREFGQDDVAADSQGDDGGVEDGGELHFCQRRKGLKESDRVERKVADGAGDGAGAGVIGSDRR